MMPAVNEDSPTEAERRANPRFPSEVSVRLPDRRFFITYKGDVSAGGVYLTTAIPLRRGDRVELKFILPDGVEVTAEGVVLNQRPEDRGLGVGVKFTKIGSKFAAALGLFLKRAAVAGS